MNISAIKVSYYPGCSLEGTARLDYSESMLGVCEALGITLEEVPDWNCCGATAAHSIRPKAGVELAGRNLVLAGKMPYSDLLVPCPMCYNRLKVASHILRSRQKNFKSVRVQGDSKYEQSNGQDIENVPSERYSIRLDSIPKIWDLANFFATDDILYKIKEQVKKPLKGLKVVCYYGCMANRPPEVTDEPNYENPQSMDNIVKVLGGEAVDWPFKTDCCGASLALSERQIVLHLTAKLFDMALRSGAHAFVVSCQMCQANLDMYQKQLQEQKGERFSLPVYYFTELIGVACRLPDVSKWLSRHISDPFTLLRKMGFIETKQVSSNRRGAR